MMELPNIQVRDIKMLEMNSSLQLWKKYSKLLENHSDVRNNMGGNTINTVPTKRKPCQNSLSAKLKVNEKTKKKKKKKRKKVRKIENEMNKKTVANWSLWFFKKEVNVIL